MHEILYKNWIVHQENIENAKKKDNFTIFAPQVAKGIRNKVWDT